MRGLQIGAVVLAVVIAGLFLVGCKNSLTTPSDHPPMMVLNGRLHVTEETMVGEDFQGLVPSTVIDWDLKVQELLAKGRIIYSLANLPLHVPPGDWVVITPDNYEAYKQYVKGSRVIIASLDEGIQQAIDVAEAGDTILVPPGTYTENLVVDKGVKLKALGSPEETIIDGGGKGPVIRVAWDEGPQGVSRPEGPTVDELVLIDGVTIRNGKSQNGAGILYLVGPPVPLWVNNTVIENNKADENGGGVHVTVSSGWGVWGKITFEDSPPSEEGVSIIDRIFPLPELFPDEDYDKVDVKLVPGYVLEDEGDVAAGEGDKVMYLVGPPVVITNTVVRNNEAGQDGGGIFFEPTIPGGTNPWLKGDSDNARRLRESPPDPTSYAPNPCPPGAEMKNPADWRPVPYRNIDGYNVAIWINTKTGGWVVGDPWSERDLQTRLAGFAGGGRPNLGTTNLVWYERLEKELPTILNDYGIQVDRLQEKELPDSWVSEHCDFSRTPGLPKQGQSGGLVVDDSEFKGNVAGGQGNDLRVRMGLKIEEALENVGAATVVIFESLFLDSGANRVVIDEGVAIAGTGNTGLSTVTVLDGGGRSTVVAVGGTSQASRDDTAVGTTGGDAGGSSTETADLAITMEASPDPVQVGETLTYTITVVNHGPAPARDVTVAVALPFEVTAQTISADGGEGSLVAGVPLLDWEQIAPGGRVVGKVIVLVEDTPSGGTLANKATVAAANNEGEPQGNNQAIVITGVREGTGTGDTPSGEPDTPAGTVSAIPYQGSYISIDQLTKAPPDRFCNWEHWVEAVKGQPVATLDGIYLFQANACGFGVTAQTKPQEINVEEFLRGSGGGLTPATAEPDTDVPPPPQE